jgi:hypothetical protein
MRELAKYLGVYNQDVVYHDSHVFIPLKNEWEEQATQCVRDAHLIAE